MIQRILVRTSVGLFTFLIGMIISPVRWDCHGIVHGRLFDGGGGFTSISCTASNSRWLATSTEGYPTITKASQVFENRISKAVTLIERNQKSDQKGKRIGPRAVTISVNPENGEQFASVFWLDEKVIISIESTSLRYALESERRQDR